MNYVRPDIVNGAQVFKAHGPYRCPYCRAEVADSLGNDVGWVLTPLRQTEPRYICLGCAEDIYSTCASHGFLDNPYVGIVEDASKVERIELRQFRKICLSDQLNILNQRINGGIDMRELERRKRHVQEILESL